MNETAVWFDRTMREPHAQLGVDEMVIDHVRRNPRRAWVRIWRNERCLVATPREAGNVAFPAAARLAAARGWPVVVRRSGGSVVPHEPGMLQVTFVRAAMPPLNIEACYAALTRPLMAALTELGAVDVMTQELAGSVCDGRYNLSVGGRKICGTAQRWVARQATSGPQIVLGHAVLFVEVGFRAAVEAVDAFYRDLQLPRHFNVAAHTDCRDLPGAAASDRWQKAAHAVATAFRAQGSDIGS